MATIKSFTSLEQSRKLAEILPLESADYYHATDAGVVITAPYITYCGKERCVPAYKGAVPCWSLAALLDIIRKAIGYTLQTTYDKNPKVYIVCELGDKPYSMESSEYDNEVDACYEMIIKLNELNLL